MAQAFADPSSDQHGGAQQEGRRVNDLEDVIQLGNNFIMAAKTYATMVIGERHKPRKVIESITRGEELYIVHDVILEIPVDKEVGRNRWMFGWNRLDNISCGKASNHDLQASAYCFISDKTTAFSFPLIALIDFQGIRVFAKTHLPLEKATLVYGSADGGATVLTKEEIHKTLLTIAESLHLQPHKPSADPKIEMALATDIKVYELDGRTYLTNLERVFPPVHSRVGTSGSNIFYHKFRPEALQLFRKDINREIPALSSDGLSLFQHADEAASLNETIKKASTKLLTFLDKAAQELFDDDCYLLKSYREDALSTIAEPSFDSIIPKEKLLHYMHSKGLNARYLGLLTLKLVELLTKANKDISPVYFLLENIIVRAAKNSWRSDIRISTDNIGLLSQNVAVTTLNSMIDFASYFDKIFIFIDRHFIRTILQPAEVTTLKELFETHLPKFNVKWILIRFCQLNGIGLNQSLVSSLSKEAKHISHADLRFYPVMRVSPVLDYYCGIHYLMKTRHSMPLNEKLELYSIARRHFETVLDYPFLQVRDYYCLCWMESILFKRNQKVNWFELTLLTYNTWKDDKPSIKLCFYFLLCIFLPLLNQVPTVPVSKQIRSLPYPLPDDEAVPPNIQIQGKPFAQFLEEDLKKSYQLFNLTKFEGEFHEVPSKYWDLDDEVKKWILDSWFHFKEEVDSDEEEDMPYTPSAITPDDPNAPKDNQSTTSTTTQPPTDTTIPKEAPPTTPRISETNKCNVCSSNENLQRCSQCRTVYYCSRACQTKDWPSHKATCLKVLLSNN